MNLQSFLPARESAEKAKQYAETPEQQLEAAALLSHLNSFERQSRAPAAANTTSAASPVAMPLEPLQHVEGLVMFYDCSEKVQRLRVKVDSKEMVLALGDPKEIVVRNMQGGHLDLQCGAQKPFWVGVFYVPAEGAAADGVIRELVF